MSNVSNAFRGLIDTAVAGMVICAFGSFLACSTVKPPGQHEDPFLDDSQDDPGRTAEWLFVTAEGKPARGKTAQCSKVLSWVQGEKNCTGELCAHARDLGREWLIRCTEHAPAQKEPIEAFVGAAKKRADQSPDACVQSGTQLLRTDECGDLKTCTAMAQRWIARCGPSYATPLIVLMLSRKLERRYSERTRIEFDVRSCETLADQVKGAFRCDGEKACKPGVDAAKAWQQHCFDKKRGVPIALAFRLADVFVGAGQSVDPIPLEAGVSSLAGVSAPLITDDDKGMVLWVCGERPKDLNAYLRIRKGCAPGEVMVARVDAKNEFRVVAVPHPSDSEYLAAFPFLEVKGERDARDQAALQQFRGKLQDAAAEARGRQPQAAIDNFARAIIPNTWTVVRSDGFQKALGEVDSRMAPAFKAWGKRKVAKARGIRKNDAFAAFVGRAFFSPLSDTRMDGRISPGDYAAPASLTLSDWMPTSFEAYRTQLEKLERDMDRRIPTSDAIERNRASVKRDIKACADAEKKAQEAVDATARCLFEATSCAPDKTKALSATASSHRQRAKRARQNLSLILTSAVLSPSETERLEAERISSGCLDP